MKLVVYKRQRVEGCCVFTPPLPTPVLEITNLGDKTEARICMWRLYPHGYDGEIHDEVGNIVDLIRT